MKQRPQASTRAVFDVEKKKHLVFNSVGNEGPSESGLEGLVHTNNPTGRGGKRTLKSERL